MRMRKARRVSTLFHIVFTSLAIAACTKGTPDAKQTQAPPERADKPSDSTTFRVALLTPGPISDQSWNGGAYKGLMRIRDSLGATVSHIQTKTPAEFEEQFRQYGAQGYDLVFGHAFEFQDAAQRVGPDFPRALPPGLPSDELPDPSREHERRQGRRDRVCLRRCVIPGRIERRIHDEVQ